MKRSPARSPEAISFARDERAKSNEFASTIWQWIRTRQICHQKFRREFPIPPYSADFCCVELRLILEIDGAEHFTEAGRERDRVRDDWLHREGYRVVRIAGFDVVRDGELVHKRIEAAVRERIAERSSVIDPSPSPPAPLTEAGRGETIQEEMT